MPYHATLHSSVANDRGRRCSQGDAEYVEDDTTMTTRPAADADGCITRSNKFSFSLVKNVFKKKRSNHAVCVELEASLSSFISPSLPLSLDRCAMPRFRSSMRLLSAFFHFYQVCPGHFFKPFEMLFATLASAFAFH